MSFSLSETSFFLLFTAILLVVYGLSAYATYRVSQDRGVPGWMRVLWIIAFLVWPVITPLIYLYIGHKFSRRDEEKRISFR